MHGDERGLIEGLADAAFREHGQTIVTVVAIVVGLVLGLLLRWLIRDADIHAVVETSTTKSIAE